MSRFTLDATQLPELQQYLQQRRWIAPAEEVLSARKPGEGNMNYTLRIRTNFRTFILKQARDYVEKYPDIPAPSQRAVIEGQFYELIQTHESLRAMTPELSGMDEDNKVLMMEDLGESSDFSNLYAGDQSLTQAEITALMGFLGALHRIGPGDSRFDLSNRDMRALNAEHIFRYPFLEDNGFDLDQITPGLQAAAMPYKTDADLKRQVAALEAHYLADGQQLLHGDYYPGSWLRTLNGVKVIDPEFCFFGPAEFDLSVMLAHSYLTQQPEAVREAILGQYPNDLMVDQALCRKLTGVEILRRVIGLAQLPLSMDLPAKQALLAQAREMVMAG